MKIFVNDGVGWIVETYERDGPLTYALAEELAEDYVGQGDYEQGLVIVHVCTRRFSREDGDILTEWDVRVMVEPDVPDCQPPVYVDTGMYDHDRDHDWQSPHEIVGGLEENPGVGPSDHGGVVAKAVCSHCGMYRVTDTGATDHTGQRYTRVTYEDPDEESLTWIEEKEE